MSREIKASEVAWTKRHLDMLAVRGTWSVPRVGIVFQKTAENEITLIAAMPFMAEMRKIIMQDSSKPFTEKELIEAQQEDFFCIAARARAGGYAVKSRVATIKENEE